MRNVTGRGSVSSPKAGVEQPGAHEEFAPRRRAWGAGASRPPWPFGDLCQAWSPDVYGAVRVRPESSPAAARSSRGRRPRVGIGLPGRHSMWLATLHQRSRRARRRTSSAVKESLATRVTRKPGPRDSTCIRMPSRSNGQSAIETGPCMPAR